MKAILIDDEKPALLHLSRLIRADGRLQIEGAYLTAQDGLKHLARDKVDVVFLDIGMPEMNGLEAAQYIQQIDANIKIVYITAYANYAIDAFELHALDYLLKPIDDIRFAKTLDRIHIFVPLIPEQNKEASEVFISCFKRLELVKPAHAVGKFKWRTLKSQELFAYLLHHRGKWIPKQQIIESIWSEYGEDKAWMHLHTSIYQTRKLLRELGGRNAVEYALDSYRLSSDGLTTDAELFEAEFGDIKEINELRWVQYDALLSLYRGEYLAEHDYAWSNQRRSQLDQLYLAATMSMARYELSSSNERKALLRLLSVQDKEPYSEVICRLILTAYANLQENEALEQYYETFVKLIRDELGVEPEPETLELYLQLMPIE